MNKAMPFRRLKGKKAIATLFEKGTFIKHGNLGIKFLTLDGKKEPFSIDVGVTVSKRNLPKAVDRNLVKRRLREAFRVQKKHILDKSESDAKKTGHVLLMIFYLDKKILPYQSILVQMEGVVKKMKGRM